MGEETAERAFDSFDKLAQRVKDDDFLTFLYVIVVGVFLLILAKVCVPPYLTYRANNLESRRKWGHNDKMLQGKIEKRLRRADRKRNGKQ